MLFNQLTIMYCYFVISHVNVLVNVIINIYIQIYVQINICKYKNFVTNIIDNNIVLFLTFSK